MLHNAHPVVRTEFPLLDFDKIDHTLLAYVPGDVSLPLGRRIREPVYLKVLSR
jgi:hypothetical protein